jgi:hypothetical protein
MLAAIGDVRRDGMDPFERVEDAHRGAGAGIRRRLDLETAVLAPADTVDRKRRASDVARDALEALSVFGGNDIAGEDVKERSAAYPEPRRFRPRSSRQRQGSGRRGKPRGFRRT